jgi:hypothetical protein
MMWGHGGTLRRFQADKQPNKKILLGKTLTKVQSCQILRGKKKLKSP